MRLRARREHSCPRAPPLSKNDDEDIVTFSARIGWDECEHLLLFKPCRAAILPPGWSLQPSGPFDF